MSRSLQILAVAVLALVPLLSLANGVAGRPICCWGMRSCPMAGAGTGRTAGMAAMPGMPGCQMQAACHSVAPAPPMLAAPSVPLFPPAALGWLATEPGAPDPSPALAAAGLRGHSPSIFHVPLA